MISPYTAPASTLTTEALTVHTMRWHGVLYFASTPALLMIVVQVSEIYTASRSGPIYWHLKLFEPVLFFAPLCLLMAGTGYAIATRCCSRAIGGALLLGCEVGASWAMIVFIAGTTIAQLNGAAPLTLDHVARLLLGLLAFFCLLAVVLCIFTRWRGARLGFASSAK